MKFESQIKRICSVLVILMSVSAAGCGGGGGGTDEDSSSNAIPEGAITYNVGNYWYDDDAVHQDLTVTKGEAGSATVWADLQGEYDSTTGIITAEINRYMIIGSTSLWSKYNSYVNTCWVTVTDEIEMAAGGSPAKGAWKITFNGISLYQLGFDSIILEVTGSGLDVTACLDNAAVQYESLSWDDLDAIENQDDPPACQLFSWVAYSVWMLYYEIIFIEGNTITAFDDRLGEFASSKTITIDGAVFPPNTGTAGSLEITWVDSSGNGTPGERDGFSCSFTNWWEDDPADDYDMLYNGELNFMEYIGGDDSAGFNCIFDGFTMQETYNGSVETDSALTLNGGFHLSMSW